MNNLNNENKMNITNKGNYGYKNNSNTQSLKNNKTTNILISTIQNKNPILKDFFFYYNFDNSIQCDFQVAGKYFGFFLSLKYHEAFPSYIEDKLKKFDQCNKTNTSNNNINSITSSKYLFCIIDLSEKNENDFLQYLTNNKLLNMNVQISNHEYDLNLFDNDDELLQNNNALNNNSEKFEKLLTDLNFICINTNTAFIFCYSGYDLAQYIYSLSQMENTNYVEEKMKSINLEENLLEAICMINSINKTDATHLLNNFQDIKSICTASPQILSLVPGMTQKKIKSIEEFIKYDFTKFNKSSI